MLSHVYRSCRRRGRKRRFSGLQLLCFLDERAPTSGGHFLRTAGVRSVRLSVAFPLLLAEVATRPGRLLLRFGRTVASPRGPTTRPAVRGRTGLTAVAATALAGLTIRYPRPRFTEVGRCLRVKLENMRQMGRLGSSEGDTMRRDL